MDKTHNCGDAPRPRSLIRDISPGTSGALVGTVLFVVTACMLAVIASSGVRGLERAAAEQLRTAAAAAAVLVDPLAHERLQRREDTGGADYQQAIRGLVRFHNTQPWIEWIYTMRVREGRLYYVLDTAHGSGFALERDSALASVVMDPVRDFYLDDEPGLLPALLAGRTHVDQREYAAQSRMLRSAQAPVFDASGGVIAILGIDADTQAFRAAQRGFLLRIVLALLLGALLAIAIGLLTTRLHRGLRSALERLEREGTTDTATGLGNRSQFLRALAVAASEAQRTTAPLSLLVFDIDCLRRINAAHGHSAGDELLRTVGARLRELARGSDVCSRTGSEEFALLMPGLGLRDAEVAFHRLSAALRAPIVLDGEARSVTISGGLALLADAQDGAEFLQRAEKALADARKTGRDRLVVAA